MVLSKGPIVQRKKPRHSQAELLTQGHSFSVEKSGTSSPARGLCLRVGREAGEQDQGLELGSDIVGWSPQYPRQMVKARRALAEGNSPSTPLLSL